MIGTGGLANVGLRAGLAPTYPARFRITAARQNQGVWEYELTDVFNLTRWIGENDGGYGLSPVVVVNPLAAVIANLLLPQPGGSPNDWAQQGTALRFNGDSVGMGEQITKANDDVNTIILWSGGAGDCVIIAAHGATASYITHRDRNAPSMQIIVAAISNMCVGPKQVYLASQMFGSGRPEDSQLIAETVNALVAPNITIMAVYGQTALALNTRNGQIRTGVSVLQQLKI